MQTQRIQALSSQLSNQIAAGEVVERPAAALKELLENSLDAHATEIRISLRGGGLDELEVADNGSGIHPDDLLLALARHATSKIHKVDDLFAIQTWGFRGEALASLAAISRLQISSRPNSQEAAKELFVEGGILQRDQRLSRPVGTTVRAENLFFNTPARKKFLKSTAAETSACLQIVYRLAMITPQVHWEMSVDGQRALTLAPTDSPTERIAQIFWEAFHTKVSAKELIPFAKNKPGGNVSGWILPTNFFIPTARGIFTFVNRRYVKDKLLQQAILTACKEVLFGQQYPQMVLLLDMPPEAVDVNVHPAKAEVRFRESGQIFGLVRSVVEETLAATKPSAFLSSAPAPEMLSDTQISFGVSSIHTPQFHQKESPQQENYSFSAPLHTAAMPRAESYFSAPSPLVQFLGTVKNTYILCQDAQGLLLIDQHAAHERITYERLKQAQLNELQVAPLLIPIGVELPSRALDLLESHFPVLERLGLQLDRSGPSLITVRSLPALLLDKTNSPRVQIHLLLREIAALAEDSIDPSSLLLEKILHVLATQSCHSSVRAGQTLSEIEAQALLAQMNATDFAGHCPHGRPTAVRLQWSEIERLFKRGL